MQIFPRCPVSDRSSKTTTIRSWLFHWPVFMISPVHYISFKFTGPEDYNQSNFTKVRRRVIFPRESKTAEFYSKDIEGAVENTLISLQGLSFSKILSLILIHKWTTNIFAPTRSAVLLRANYIPAYITAKSYPTQNYTALIDITQMNIFSVRDRNVLYFVLIGLFQSEKSSQFLSWFVPNW